MRPLNDITLTLATDPAEVSEWIESASGSLIAMDTETSGLDWSVDDLRLVQAATPDDGIAVPFPSPAATRLLCWLTRYPGQMVMHHSRFDRLFLRRHGWPFPQPHDTMLLARVLQPTESAGLKQLAANMLGFDTSAPARALKTLMRKRGWTWGTVPYDCELWWGYAALDAVLTARLWLLLSDRVTTRQREAYEAERRVADLCCEMEWRGIGLDPEYVQRAIRSHEQEIESLKAQLDAYGVANPHSRAQVVAALQALGEEWDETTPTGEPSVAAKVLAKLATPVADMVRRYRLRTKELSAYLRPMEGRTVLHPEIHSLRAVTGRMSISRPPLQQLPRGPEIRDAIVPLDRSRYLVSMDYDSMELRLLAAFSGDPTLRRAFAEGVDVHRLVASIVWHVDPEEVTTQQRTIAKNVHYGLIYGAGPAKLAEVANVPIEDVYDFLGLYQDRMTVLPWLYEQRERAQVTTLGGRTILLEDGHKAANYLIQGSAADIFKQRLLALADAGFSGALRLPVHDEIVVEVDSLDEAEEMRHLLETTVEGVRLPVSCTGLLTRWGDKYRGPDH